MNSHTPAPKAVEALPELPEPTKVLIRKTTDMVEVVAFTGEQMAEYARTAVSAALAAAQAEQAKPVDEALRALLAVVDGNKALIDSTAGDGSYVGWTREMNQALRRARAALSSQPPSPDVERQAVERRSGLERRRRITDAALFGFSTRSGSDRRAAIATPPQEAGDADAERMIERIASDWDGCMYEDAPGGAIDIGRAIRDAARSPQQEPKA